MKKNQVSSDHVASLYLDSNYYENVESYERDLDVLAKNVQSYVNEANWLDTNEFSPTESSKHLSAFKKAEAIIEELTGHLAAHVCHLLL